jgi:cell wall-associated NlpC family hydrolase
VNRKAAGSAGVGVALIFLLFLLAVPLLIVGGTSMLFAGGGSGCTQAASPPPVTQPGVSAQANSIPATYLKWYKLVGLQNNIPWIILAGIGTEESDNGQTTLPGVHSESNAFGAAGPMQIGIDGASGDAWGGGAFPGQGIIPDSNLPVPNQGVATDEDGRGSASVYDPADAIAGAAKYLNEHGFQHDPSGAIFAYNHAGWYVTAVENFASQYASGGYVVSQVNPVTPAQGQTATDCVGGTVLAALSAPNTVVATAVNYAQAQLGRPYLFGGTGPDAFDCSGLVMMAYRAAGIDMPRTARQQWQWGPKVAASAVSPGDLVFFAGADGTPTEPGHVGLVIGKNTMIEAYATGFPIRTSHFGTQSSSPDEQHVVGFTRPWAHAGLDLPPSELAAPASSATTQPGTGPAKPTQPGKSSVPTAPASTAPKTATSKKA